MIRALAAVVLLAPMLAAGDEPAIEHLGGERYRVGAIEVDKQRGRLSVPGSVLDLGPDAPLEFIAAARDGMKTYESLYELDANAFEFNVACILIGLDPEGATHPELHFDPRPVEGDPVRVTVSWSVGGERVTRAARELLLVDGQAAPAGQWVYTGSRLLEDGRYLADLAGVLIGFVHDPESIIQHRDGLGLDSYGAVTVNAATAPAPGTRIDVTVERVAR